jgi:hypothetical protein
MACPALNLPWPGYQKLAVKENIAPINQLKRRLQKEAEPQLLSD